MNTRFKSRRSRIVNLLQATICLVLLSNSTHLLANDVYKSIDANGETVYSDMPGNGSIKLDSDELNVTEAIPKPTETTTEARPGGSTSAVDDTNTTESEIVTNPLSQRLQNVSIDSPLHDQALVNPLESISVILTTDLEEGLPEGFSAQVKIDGKIVSSGPTTQLDVPTPYRGTHVMSAQILNPAGQVLVQSESITFHVIKSTVRQTQAE